MQSQLYSISKIFSEKLYRIPDYQRGYAWTNRQLKDFWNDVIQLEVGKNHYCGVVTLEKVDRKKYQTWDDDLWIIESKSYEPFFVVDGQQRLTTTVILIQAIIETIPVGKKLNFTSLDKIKEKFIFEIKESGYARSYIFGYEKDNPSYEFLKTNIYLEDSFSDYRSEETIYTHNLIAAKTYFIEQLKDKNLDEIETLYKKVTQHLLFNIYTIETDIDVFVAFETMNNRGKPLSHLELLKNRLIYLTTKMSIDDVEKQDIRKKINESWKAIYHYLGKKKDKPLKDDEFLANHFILYVYPNITDLDGHRYSFYRIYNHEAYADLLFDKKFSSRRLYDLDDLIKLDEIVEYVESLQKSVITWYNINVPEDSKYSGEEKFILKRLHKLDFNDVAPYILALYNRRIKKEIRINILKALEKYLFVDTLIPNIYQAINLNFRLIATRIPKSSYSEIETNAKKLAKDIDDFGSSHSLIKEFKSKLQYMSFYGWPASRYFLFEYEISIQEKTKNKTQKIDWKDFTIVDDDYVSVEHIYPQKAVDIYWKDIFNTYTLKNRRILCESLGNLLALSIPKNSSLQNKPFPAKKEKGDGYVGYKYGSYSEIEVAQSLNWTPVEILNRGIKLLEFMEKRWQLNLGSRKQKIELLKLDFI